jgi:DNA-binding Xre family transcriptional regulator
MSGLGIAGVHQGQRLEHFVTNAPHGKGLTMVAQILKISRSTVYKMYKAHSLDFNVIIEICALYNLKIHEFLGIRADQLPEPLIIDKPVRPDAQMEKLGEIERKVDMILRKLK